MLFALSLGLLVAACEKPDASHVTSPSVLALLGTTEGNVAFDPPETPPAPVDGPDGWRFQLENVRFSELENGDDSLQVVTQIQARPGPGLELWIVGANGPIYRWSGGSARAYDGTVCFQVRLEEGDEQLAMGPGPYSFVMGFRDPATNEMVVAKEIRIAGFAPETESAAARPGAESDVGRVLLGCPRSVI